MKNTCFRFIALAAFLGLTACSTVYRVYSDPEPGVNFSRYHTYQWLGKPEVEDASQYVWIKPETEEKIRASVQAQLARYAIQPGNDAPDLTLHYHMVIKNVLYYNRDWQCRNNEQYPLRQVPGYCNSLTPNHYREGTLLLDFIDAKTGNQVWRGAATGVVGNNMTAAEISRRIDKAVRLIFEKFPADTTHSIAGEGGGW